MAASSQLTLDGMGVVTRRTSSGAELKPYPLKVADTFPFGFPRDLHGIAMEFQSDSQCSAIFSAVWRWTSECKLLIELECGD